MPDTILAFPNLSHPVRSLMLNEGNVHSCLVVSMRRKCKAEACVQNICSCELYLNEASVKRAISNICLLKVTVEPDDLQAGGGLCFIWSDLLHVPTHMLSPRLSKPTLCLCSQSKRDVGGLFFAESCAHLPKYCRRSVSLHIHPHGGLDLPAT